MSGDTALQRDAAKSVRWTGIAHAARQGLQLGTSLLLTRLLFAEDFGLAAFVMIVVAFVDLVQDFGLSSALVQRREVSQRLISTVFWFNGGVGAVAGLAVWFGASWIAAFAGDVRVVPLMGAAALLFLLRGVAFLPRAELTRRLDFETLSMAELTAALLGATVAITAAFLGAGVWSLILQPLVASALLAVWLWRSTAWRPGWEFSLAELASVRRFSAWLAAHNVLDFFHLYGAHLLIAHYFEEERLGLYYLAFRVTTFPAGAVADSISRVLFPYLARVIDDEEHARKSYLSIVCAIGLCVFPAVVGFTAVADLFFVVVSGDAWRDCGLVAILLMPIGLSRSISATTGSLYQAKERTDLMFRWGTYYVVIVLVAFAIGVHWDIFGVAAAYSATLLFAYPLYKVPAGLIGVRVRDIASALVKPVALCTVMAATVVGMRALVEPIVSPGVALSLAIVTGVAVYASLVTVFAGGEIRSVLARLTSR